MGNNKLYVIANSDGHPARLFVYTIGSTGIMSYGYTKQYTLWGKVTNSPAIAQNGRIYIASYNASKLSGSIEAFEIDTDTKLSASLGNCGEILSSPTIDLDGNVFLIANSKIYKFNPSLISTSLTCNNISPTASPAIYIQSVYDWYIMAAYSGEAKVGRFYYDNLSSSFLQTEAGIDYSPVMATGPDGDTCYVVDKNQKLYAINPYTMTQKWKSKTLDGTIISAPLISPPYQGTGTYEIYVITKKDDISKNEGELWRFPSQPTGNLEDVQEISNKTLNNANPNSNYIVSSNKILYYAGAVENCTISDKAIHAYDIGKQEEVGNYQSYYYILGSPILITTPKNITSTRPYLFFAKDTGTFSQIMRVTDTTSPAIPQFITTSTATNTGTFSLSWNPVTDNSAPVSYMLKKNSVVYQTLTNTSFFEGAGQPLDEGIYTYKLRAKDYLENESSGDSSAITVKVDKVNPAKPALKIHNIAKNSISLSWEAVTDPYSAGKSGVSEYILKWSDSVNITNGNWDTIPDFVTLNYTFETGSLVQTAEALSSNTLYHLGIRVKDNAGNLSDVATKDAKTIYGSVKSVKIFYSPPMTNGVTSVDSTGTLTAEVLDTQDKAIDQINVKWSIIDPPSTEFLYLTDPAAGALALNDVPQTQAVKLRTGTEVGTVKIKAEAGDKSSPQEPIEIVPGKFSQVAILPVFATYEVGSQQKYELFLQDKYGNTIDPNASYYNKIYTKLPYIQWDWKILNLTIPATAVNVPDLNSVSLDTAQITMPTTSGSGLLLAGSCTIETPDKKQTSVIIDLIPGPLHSFKLDPPSNTLGLNSTQKVNIINVYDANQNIITSLKYSDFIAPWLITDETGATVGSNIADTDPLAEPNAIALFKSKNKAGTFWVSAIYKDNPNIFATATYIITPDALAKFELSTLEVKAQTGNVPLLVVRASDEVNNPIPDEKLTNDYTFNWQLTGPKPGSGSAMDKFIDHATKWSQVTFKPGTTAGRYDLLVTCGNPYVHKELKVVPDVLIGVTIEPQSATLEITDTTNITLKPYDQFGNNIFEYDSDIINGNNFYWDVYSVNGNGTETKLVGTPYGYVDKTTNGKTITFHANNPNAPQGTLKKAGKYRVKAVYINDTNIFYESATIEVRPGKIASFVPIIYKDPMGPVPPINSFSINAWDGNTSSLSPQPFNADLLAEIKDEYGNYYKKLYTHPSYLENQLEFQVTPYAPGTSLEALITFMDVNTFGAYNYVGGLRKFHTPKAGTYTITVSFPGNPYDLPSQQYTVTVNPLSMSKISLEASTNTINLANPPSVVTLEALLQDKYWNKLPLPAGQKITWIHNHAAGNFNYNNLTQTTMEVTDMNNNLLNLPESHNFARQGLHTLQVYNGTIGSSNPVNLNVIPGIWKNLTLSFDQSSVLLTKNNVPLNQSVPIWIKEAKDSYDNPVIGPTWSAFKEVYTVTITRDGTTQTYPGFIDAGETPTNADPYTIASFNSGDVAGKFYITRQNKTVPAEKWTYVITVTPEALSSFDWKITPANPTVDDKITFEAYNLKDNQGNKIEPATFTDGANLRWVMTNSPGGGGVMRVLGTGLTLEGVLPASFESYGSGYFDFKASYNLGTVSSTKTNVYISGGTLESFTVTSEPYSIVILPGHESNITLKTAKDYHGNNKIPELNASNDFEWAITYHDPATGSITDPHPTWAKFEALNATGKKFVLGSDPKPWYHDITVKHTASGKTAYAEVKVKNDVLNSFKIKTITPTSTGDITEIPPITVTATNNPTPEPGILLFEGVDKNGYPVSDAALIGYDFNWSIVGNPDGVALMELDAPIPITFARILKHKNIAGKYTIKIVYAGSNPDIVKLATVEVLPGPLTGALKIVPETPIVNLETDLDYTRILTLEGKDPFGNYITASAENTYWNILNPTDIIIKSFPKTNPISWGTSEAGQYKLKVTLLDPPLPIVETIFTVYPANLATLELFAADTVGLKTVANITYEATDKYGNTVSKPLLSTFTYTVTRENSESSQKSKLTAGTGGAFARFAPGTTADKYYFTFSKEGVNIINDTFTITSTPGGISTFSVTWEPLVPTVTDTFTLYISDPKDSDGNIINMSTLTKGGFAYEIGIGPIGTYPAPQAPKHNDLDYKYSFELPEPTSYFSRNSGDYKFTVTYNNCAPQDVTVNFKPAALDNITLKSNKASTPIVGGTVNIWIDSAKDQFQNEQATNFKQGDFFWKILGPNGNQISDLKAAFIAGKDTDGKPGKTLTIASFEAGIYTLVATYAPNGVPTDITDITDDITIEATPDTYHFLDVKICASGGELGFGPVNISAGGTAEIWVQSAKDQYQNTTTGPTYNQFLAYYSPVTITKEGAPGGFESLFSSADQPKKTPYKVGKFVPTAAGKYYLSGTEPNSGIVGTFVINVVPAGLAKIELGANWASAPFSPIEDLSAISVDSPTVMLSIIGKDAFNNPTPPNTMAFNQGFTWLPTGIVSPLHFIPTPEVTFAPSGALLGKNVITVYHTTTTTLIATKEITVVSGAAHHLILSTEAASIKVDTGNTKIYYTVQDVNNNPKTGIGLSDLAWIVKKNGLVQENPLSYFTDFQNGIAKFKPGEQSGIFTIVAQYAALGTQELTITVTPDVLFSFSVTPANAVIAENTPQTSFSIVNVKDKFENPITDLSNYYFYWPETTIKPNGETATAFGTGYGLGWVATLETLPAMEKTFQINASKQGDVSPKAHYDLKVTITPSAIYFDKLAINGVLPGATTTDNDIILITPKAFGQMVKDEIYHLTWTTGIGSIPDDLSLGINKDKHVIPYTVGTAAGVYELQLAAESTTGTLITTIDVNVVADKIHTFDFSLPSNITAGTIGTTTWSGLFANSIQVTTAEDQYKNAIDANTAKASVTWKIGGATAANDTPFTKAGTYTIAANWKDANNVNRTTSEVLTVIPSTTIGSVKIIADKTLVTVKGPTVNLTLEGYDTFGNVVSVDTLDNTSFGWQGITKLLAPTWKAIFSPSPYEFLPGEFTLQKDPGTYVVTVFRMPLVDQIKDSILLTVEAGSANSVVLTSEANANTVRVSDPDKASATFVKLYYTVKDELGNPLPNIVLDKADNWTVKKNSVIQEDPLDYIANIAAGQAKFKPGEKTGEFIIQAKYGELSSAKTITATPEALKSFAIAPTNVVVAALETQGLSFHIANAIDTFDNSITGNFLNDYVFKWPRTTISPTNGASVPALLADPATDDNIGVKAVLQPLPAKDYTFTVNAYKGAIANPLLKSADLSVKVTASEIYFTPALIENVAPGTIVENLILKRPANFDANLESGVFEPLVWTAGEGVFKSNTNLDNIKYQVGTGAKLYTMEVSTYSPYSPTLKLDAKLTFAVIPGPVKTFNFDLDPASYTVGQSATIKINSAVLDAYNNEIVDMNKIRNEVKIEVTPSATAPSVNEEGDGVTFGSTGAFTQIGTYTFTAKTNSGTVLATKLATVELASVTNLNLTAAKPNPLGFGETAELSLTNDQSIPLAKTDVTWIVSLEGVTKAAGNLTKVSEFIKASELENGFALFNPGTKAGEFTVSVNYNNTPSNVLKVSVTAGALKTFTVSPAKIAININPIKPVQVTIEAKDANGNIIRNLSAYTFNWNQFVENEQGDVQAITITNKGSIATWIPGIPSGIYNLAVTENTSGANATVKVVVVPDSVTFDKTLVTTEVNTAVSPKLKLIVPAQFSDMFAGDNPPSTDKPIKLYWNAGKGTVNKSSLNSITYTPGITAEVYHLTVTYEALGKVTESIVDINAIPGLTNSMALFLSTNEVEAGQTIDIFAVGGSAKDVYGNMITDIPAIRDDVVFSFSPTASAPEIVETGEFTLAKTLPFPSEGAYTLIAKNTNNKTLDEKTIKVNQAVLVTMILTAEQENLAFGGNTEFTLYAASHQGAITLTKDMITAWKVMVNGEIADASTANKLIVDPTAGGVASFNPGTKAGTFEITAAYNNMESNPVTVSVATGNLAKFSISIIKPVVGAYSTKELSVIKAIDGSDNPILNLAPYRFVWQGENNDVVNPLTGGNVQAFVTAGNGEKTIWKALPPAKYTGLSVKAYKGEDENELYSVSFTVNVTPNELFFEEESPMYVPASNNPVTLKIVRPDAFDQMLADKIFTPSWNPGDGKLISKSNLDKIEYKVSTEAGTLHVLTFTATSSVKTLIASIDVIVKAAPITSFEYYLPKNTIEVGQTLEVFAKDNTATDVYGNIVSEIKTIRDEINFTLSSATGNPVPDIAEGGSKNLSGTGQLFGTIGKFSAAGTYTLTAKNADGKTLATKTITVTKASLTDLNLSVGEGKSNLDFGEATDLYLTASADQGTIPLSKTEIAWKVMVKDVITNTPKDFIKFGRSTTPPQVILLK
ncbi:MAG: hypothetical protein NT099_00795 [Candidatus Saganbacteria bacterium]|nr:hypothetical protein [Candidatus Saganbacteria bacterium]